MLLNVVMVVGNFLPKPGNVIGVLSNKGKLVTKCSFILSCPEGMFFLSKTEAAELAVLKV